jgi:hypothetical protein
MIPICDRGRIAARGGPRKTAAVLGHFSAHHVSVSPLRGTQMTEKWMTEKCAQTSAARTAAFTLQHSHGEELT